MCKHLVPGENGFLTWWKTLPPEGDDTPAGETIIKMYVANMSYRAKKKSTEKQNMGVGDLQRKF